MHDENTDAACPASAQVLKRPAAEPSPPHSDAPDNDSEYEEVDDLIYERTGTLCFPYPSRIVESAVRAAEAAGAQPEATQAPSVRSESSWSSLGRIVRDLRAVSAQMPGVSMLATVDVTGGNSASARRRSEPPTPPSVAASRARSLASTGSSTPPAAPRSLPQQVVVGPASLPPRRSSMVASRALTKVVPPSVPAPSSPAARHPGPTRTREVRSSAASNTQRNAERPTKPSLRAKQQVLIAYPSLGQRIINEVRRLPLAKKSAALGVLAALCVGLIFVASSALLSRRAPPRQKEATRSGALAAVRERAAVPAPAHGDPGVRAVAASQAAREVPDSTLTEAAPPAAFEETPPGPSPSRVEGAARSRPRAPRPARAHEPCDCFPGDPLCGCL